jgi:ribulose-5-phosphate 4-epimerase/fuculose-1-phosphate aldolase
VQAVVHIHTHAGMAISAHKDGLRFITQGAMRFYGGLSYHDYLGIAEVEEAESIANDIGNAKAMILRNHGLLVVGRSMGEAISRMNYLVSAIESQLMIEATGVQNILTPAPEICAKAAAQWNSMEDRGMLKDWPALLRWMDDLDSGYRN